ncbi:MAG: heat shock factor binding protein 1-domain-containing protein [Benniella sp.]|nr:MAG: heat shock factor binding protein 1-domain-containing protein [Benniella sp.]
MTIDNPTESGLPEGSTGATSTAPLQPQTQDDPSNITPQELTGFVEKLLKQLNDKLDGVSTQIFTRMDEMSSRIEDLEKSIGELIQDADEDSKTPPASKTT